MTHSITDPVFTALVPAQPPCHPHWVQAMIEAGADPWHAFGEWEVHLDKLEQKYLGGDYSGWALQHLLDSMVREPRERLAESRIRQTQEDRNRAARRAIEAMHAEAERVKTEEQRRAEHEAWQAGARERAEKQELADAEARCKAEEKRQAAAELRRRQLAGTEPLPESWWGHLLWLHRTFGGRSFTTGDVASAAVEDEGWIYPPPLRAEIIAPGFNKKLGFEYAKIGGTSFDGASIRPGGIVHGVRRWTVLIPPQANAT